MAEDNVRAIFVWVIVALSLLFTVGLVLILIARRYWSSGSGESSGTTILTLDKLRQMHRQGQVSDEEFQALKDSIIDQSRDS